MAHLCKRSIVDAYQCKYHVAKSTVFTSDKLIDSKFIKNNQSMLQRLYEAYQKYAAEGDLFRLHVVSSSSWETQDPFCKFLATENYVRSTFYEKGGSSVQGRIRAKFASHLGIAENELKPFLDKIRFDLGINRKYLAQSLDDRLRMTGLLPLDLTTTNSRYSELAWKWLEQGSHSFDKNELEKLVERESLRDAKRRSLLLIRHQSLNPINPETARDDLPSDLRKMDFTELAIDLSHLFVDGKLFDPRAAINAQQNKVTEIEKWYKNNPKLEFAYYGIAHIPLVFLIGYQLNIRRTIHILEHNRHGDKWDLLSSKADYPKLTVQKNTLANIDREAVIKFGVSYPIADADVGQVVPDTKLTFDLTIPNPALDTVTSMEQLESYVNTFRKALDEIHNVHPQIEKVHVFYAGPVSLAFRCGQIISPTIHPKVLVYNYFLRDVPKYKWGVHVNISPDSPEFLVEL